MNEDDAAFLANEEEIKLMNDLGIYKDLFFYIGNEEIVQHLNLSAKSTLVASSYRVDKPGFVVQPLKEAPYYAEEESYIPDKQFRYCSCEEKIALFDWLRELLVRHQQLVRYLCFDQLDITEKHISRLLLGESSDQETKHPLIRLDVSQCDVRDFTWLEAFLMRNNNSLKVLSLDGNNCQEAAPLFRTLYHNTTLVKLNLGNNRITRVEEIASFLETNKTLQSLDLSSNEISNVDVIAKSLLRNSSLKVLFLTNNAIENVYHFGLTLKNNQSLRILDLSLNNITIIESICSGLKASNFSLSELNLRYNSIESVDSAFDVIRNSFVKIDLYSNTFATAAEKLAQYERLQRAQANYFAKYHALLVLLHAKHSPDVLKGLCFHAVQWRFFFRELNGKKLSFVPHSPLRKIVDFLTGGLFPRRVMMEYLAM